MKYAKEIQKTAKAVANKFGLTEEDRTNIESFCLEAGWKAEGQIDEEKAPLSFLYRVMENRAISYLRSKKKVKQVVLSPDIEDKTEDMTSVLIAKETLEEFLAKLDPIDKQIVTFLVDGKAIAEIATALDKSPAAIRTRISRGRKNWGKIINEKENP